MATGNVEALWARTVFSPVPVRNAFEVTVERLAQSIRLGVLVDGARLPPRGSSPRPSGSAGSRCVRRSKRCATPVWSNRAGAAAGAHSSCLRRSSGHARQVRSAHRWGTRSMMRLPCGAWSNPARPAWPRRRTLTAVDRASLLRYLADATNCEPASRRLADSRLHLAIAALGGSASVTAVVADVQMRLDELLRAIPVIAANIAHSNVQHAAIVDAILAGQSARARSEMEEHVDGTAALLRGFLS